METEEWEVGREVGCEVLVGWGGSLDLGGMEGPTVEVGNRLTLEVRPCRGAGAAWLPCREGNMAGDCLPGGGGLEGGGALEAGGGAGGCWGSRVKTSPLEEEVGGWQGEGLEAWLVWL